jgi:hypothetical protein
MDVGVSESSAIWARAPAPSAAGASPPDVDQRAWRSNTISTRKGRHRGAGHREAQARRQQGVRAIEDGRGRIECALFAEALLEAALGRQNINGGQGVRTDASAPGVRRLPGGKTVRLALAKAWAVRSAE